MIKIVLFDLGNVILPFDLMRLATRLTRFSHYSASDILGRIVSDEIVQDFETGKMPPENYFQHVLTSCEIINLSFEKFLVIFNDIFDENQQVIDLIKELKTKYKLGLISNINPIHAAHIQENFDAVTHFEQLIFSSDAGYRKPDPTIYKIALSQFSAQPAEALFIDDLPINVQAAKKMGMHGIHFQDHAQLKKDLQQVGVS